MDEDLPDELRPPEKPNLPSGWGEEYREQWLTVEINVHMLARYVRDFGAAALLAEHALPMYGAKNAIARWRNIAGRDGATSLYHYLKGIRAVRRQCSAIVPVRRLLNMAAMRQTIRSFEKRFPDAEHVRHPISHAADFVSTPTQMRMHGLETEEGMRWTHGWLYADDVFRVVYRPTHSKESGQFSYDLTRDAVRFLANNLREFYRAFEPASRLALEQELLRDSRKVKRPVNKR